MGFFFNVTGVYLTSRTITDPTKGGAIVMTKTEGKYAGCYSPVTKNKYIPGDILRKTVLRSDS